MKDLKDLTDHELLHSTDQAVEVEKESIKNVTRHFQEVFKRRLYLPEYPSMFEMLKLKYGYCNGSAQIRINAIRLIRDVPEVQEKLERGEMSMTVAAQIQSFLYSEKRSEKTYSRNEKLELIQACTGKSKLEAEREFVKRNPEIEKREKVRPISDKKMRLETTISDETYQKMTELKDLLSHVDPKMTLGSLVERLVEDGLEKYSPQRRAERAKKRFEKKNRKEAAARSNVKPAAAADKGSGNEPRGSEREPCGQKSKTSNPFHPDEVSTSPASAKLKRTRYIPAKEKHQVPYDGEGCTHVDPRSGRRCGSKRFLQLDHVKPYARGGPNAAENLRWMCAQPLLSG